MSHGGIEADVTITRLGADKFYFVTGSAFGRHDLAFLLSQAGAAPVHIQEVTSAFGVLNVCGPRSRALLAELTSADLSNAAFPYMTAQRIDIARAPVRALRATYVGELGWELHVPTEYVADLYDEIIRWARVRRHQRRLPGGRVAATGEALRGLGRYVRADTNPYEAGLGFAVKPDKPELLAAPPCARFATAGARRLLWFDADPAVIVHGGELLTHASRPLATTVRSGGFGHTVGRTIFSAYVPIELAGETDFIVDVATVRHRARRHDRPLYDPAGSAIRM